MYAYVIPFANILLRSAHNQYPQYLIEYAALKNRKGTGAYSLHYWAGHYGTFEDNVLTLGQAEQHEIVDMAVKVEKECSRSGDAVTLKPLRTGGPEGESPRRQPETE